MKASPSTPKTLEELVGHAAKAPEVTDLTGLEEGDRKTVRPRLRRGEPVVLKELQGDVNVGG